MVLSASQQAKVVKQIKSRCLGQLRIPTLLWTHSARARDRV
jgi:hypothetical protein